MCWIMFSSLCNSTDSSNFFFYHEMNLYRHIAIYHKQFKSSKDFSICCPFELRIFFIKNCMVFNTLSSWIWRQKKNGFFNIFGMNGRWSFTVLMTWAGVFCYLQERTLKPCFNLTVQVRLGDCYSFHSAQAEHFAVLPTLCGTLQSLEAWKL